MRAGTRWVPKNTGGSRTHKTEAPTRESHDRKRMCVQLGASSEESTRSRCALGCAAVPALRCTHVMVDNPDIDVEYR